MKPCACGCGELIEDRTNTKGEPIRFIFGHQTRGENHPMWKGGRNLDGQGYIKIHKPDHPFANNQGYVREHRLVIEQYYNCILLPTTEVHHINGIKDDNRIENLDVLTGTQHRKLHRNRRIDMSSRICLICGRNNQNKDDNKQYRNWYRHPVTKQEWICSKCYIAKWRIIY